MCLFCPSPQFIFHYVPYLWLASLPLCGVIWGAYHAVRQSILMLVFIIISSLIPPNWKNWIPCIDFLLFILLLSFPYTILPSIFIWIYYYSMIIAEPFLLFIEAYEAVVYITSSGKALANLVEEKPNFGKGLVLIVSGLAYFLTVVILSSGSSFPFWTRSIFGICALCLLCITIYNDYGIISDSALITLICSLVLYGSFEEINYATPFSINEDVIKWLEKSYLNQLFELPSITTAYDSKYLRLVRDHYSLEVWMFLGVRIWLMVIFLQRFLSQEEEDDGVNLTVFKVAAICLYTQAVVKRLLGHPTYLAMGRLLQAVGLGILYVVSLLYQEDVWE